MVAAADAPAADAACFITVSLHLFMAFVQQQSLPAAAVHTHHVSVVIAL